MSAHLLGFVGQHMFERNSKIFSGQHIFFWVILSILFI